MTRHHVGPGAVPRRLRTGLRLAALLLCAAGCVSDLDDAASSDCGGCAAGNVCLDGACCLLQTCEPHRGQYGTFPDGCGGILICGCHLPQTEGLDGHCVCTPGQCPVGERCDPGSGACLACECEVGQCTPMSTECGNLPCEGCTYPEACGGGAEAERCGCDGPGGTAPCDPPADRPLCWDVPEVWDSVMIPIAGENKLAAFFGLTVQAEGGQLFAYASRRRLDEASAHLVRVPLEPDGVTAGEEEPLPMLDRPGVDFATAPRVRPDGLELVFVAGNWPAEPPPDPLPPPIAVYHSFRSSTAEPWGPSELLPLPPGAEQPRSALYLADARTLLVAYRTGEVGAQGTAAFYTTGAVRGFRRSVPTPQVTDFVDEGLVVLDDPDHVTDDEVGELALGCDASAILYSWRSRHLSEPGVVALGSLEPLTLGPLARMDIAERPPDLPGHFRLAGESPDCQRLYLVEENGPGGRVVSSAKRRHCAR